MVLFLDVPLSTIQLVGPRDSGNLQMIQTMDVQDESKGSAPGEDQPRVGKWRSTPENAIDQFDRHDIMTHRATKHDYLRPGILSWQIKITHVCEFPPVFLISLSNCY